MDKYLFRRTIAAVGSVAVVLGGSIAAFAYNISDVEPLSNKSAVEQVSPDPKTLSVTKTATNEVNPVCPFCGQIIDGYDNFLTWSEIQLLASLVDLEVGIEEYECKKAVVSIVFNRMKLYDMSLEDVIFADNQFAVADKVRQHTPSEESVNAVKAVITGGVTLPEYVTFFRADDYHCWGDLIPYICIGNTYFSYSESVKNRIE